MAMAMVEAPVHLGCAYSRAGRSRRHQRQALPFPQNNTKQMLLARRYRKDASVGQIRISLAKFICMDGTGLMVAGLYRGVACALMLPSVAFRGWRLVTSIFKFWIQVHRERAPWNFRKRFCVERLSTLQQCSHDLYQRVEQHLDILRLVSSDTSVGYWCGPETEDGWGFVAGHFSRT